MNDKVGFLKFFIESGNPAGQPSFTREIVDHFPAVVYSYDLQHEKIDYINDAFTDYFGVTRNDLREKVYTLRDIFSKEDVAQIQHLINQPFPRNDGYETLYHTCRLNHHRNGSPRHFRLQGTVLKRNIDNGRVTNILFIAQDISETVNANDEIVSLRQLFDETEAMFEFGSWTLDAATNNMTWTPGLRSLLEYPEEMAGKSIPLSVYLEHVMNGYRDALQDTIHQAVATNTGFEFEYVIRTQTMKYKTVFTKASLTQKDDGPLMITGITRDITRLRNIEKEQERHIRQLNKSNKELEEFAYIASHDLQEPLRKIDMFATRLRMKLGNTLGKEEEALFDRILASSGSMKRLIDDLLEVSRANRSSNNFTMIDLRTVFDEVRADLELKIEETQSVITFHGTMPRLEAVASEMRQLFTNLLANAIKFRKQNTPAFISIHARKLSNEERKAFSLHPQRPFVRIDICDKGIGFEEEYSEKIFQIFQRLHGKAEYPGSGIGLAICKKIIENHNGLIFAHSTPGEGATFTVILPEKQF